jgi:DNA repair protein RadC
MAINRLLEGHREKMRARFMISSESLADYELLEMLLFLAIPRKDTRTLAKLLMEKFGSLSAVLNGDRDQLKTLDGIGDGVISTLQLFHEIILRIMKGGLTDSKKLINLSKAKNLERYCMAKLGHLVHEEVMALFLSGSMKLLGEEILNSGDSSEVKLYSSILITRATQHGAQRIVLAHNHPSGNSTPSEADINITGNISAILRSVGFKLVDHLIVTRSQCFSFRKIGVLS